MSVPEWWEHQGQAPKLVWSGSNEEASVAGADEQGRKLYSMWGQTGEALEVIAKTRAL